MRTFLQTSQHAHRVLTAGGEVVEKNIKVGISDIIIVTLLFIILCP